MALNVKHYYNYELPNGQYTRRREIPFRSLGELDYIGDIVMSEQDFKKLVFTTDFEEEVRLNPEHRLLLSASRQMADNFELDEQTEQMIEDSYFEKKGAIESGSEYRPHDLEFTMAQQKLGKWAGINSRNVWKNLKLRHSDYPDSDDLNVKYRYAYLIGLNDTVLAQFSAAGGFDGFNLFEIEFVIDQINELLRSDHNLCFDVAAEQVLNSIDAGEDLRREYLNLFSVIRKAYPNPSGNAKQIRLRDGEPVTKSHWGL